MMKKLGKLIALGSFGFLMGQSLIQAETFSSNASIEFYHEEIGQLRFVVENTALDFDFGSHAINEQLHREGLSVTERLGNRRVTVEDLSGNLGGWSLRVEKSAFTNMDSGHQLNSQLVLVPSRFDSTSGQVWGTESGLWLGAGAGWGNSGTVFSGAEGIHTLFWDEIVLNFWQGQVFQEGTYSSTLTWNLGITPQEAGVSIGGE